MLCFIFITLGVDHLQKKVKKVKKKPHTKKCRAGTLIPVKQQKKTKR
jgi:hypothetical protein